MKQLFAAVMLAVIGANTGAAAPLAAEIPQWRAVLLAAPPSADVEHPARIRISHRGRVVVDRSLPSATAGYQPGAIRFSDIAGTGHVLVWADVVSEGRYTSTVTVLYDFAPGSQTPRVTTRSWGDYGYVVRKIDGTSAFVTADMTYFGLFDARVFSVLPISVQAYRAGAFVDVTSAYPQLIAAQVAKYRSDFQPGVCESYEAMGAYLADLVRLGETDRGLADVTGMLPAGDDVRFFEIMNAVLHTEKLIPGERRLGAVAGIPRCDPKKKRAGN